MDGRQPEAGSSLGLGFAVPASMKKGSGRWVVVLIPNVHGQRNIAGQKRG